MYKKIFLTISLIISIVAISNTQIHAQNTAPTYQSMMELGDNEYNKQEYIKAKAYYQEALRIKTNDATAKSKLDRTIQKIREQSEKEEIFFQYLDQADTFYNNSEYENALASYNEALKIFPKDSYTLKQVETITNILDTEKEKLNSFNEIISIADRLMEQGNFAEASLQYKSALELYPTNAIALAKYEEAKAKKEEYDRQVSNFEQIKHEASDLAMRKRYAEAIAKYQDALAIFPNDTEIERLIEELSNKKKTAELYESKITAADSLYLEKSYEEAIAAYTDALSVIPDDSYASGMISRINETLNSEEYLAMQNYLNIIEQAKSLEANNQLEDAILKYQEALTLKANDEFATQKISYINELIDKKNKENELNVQYANLIAEGDKAFSDNDLSSALSSYLEAKKLIPEKSEAQTRINEVEVKLALEKQKIEDMYQEAIVSAEVNMNEENYIDAMKEYEKALKIKPEDPAAKLGLSNAQKLNDTRLAMISNEYKKIVSSGDIEFNAKNYDKAIEYYTQAVEYETGDTYPADMLTRISEMLIVNKLEVLIDTKTKITSNSGKRYTFNPIDVTSRRGNYILIKAKNLSLNSYNVFISYGDNEGRNGSLMIRVPDNQETNNYIIRIGAQYKWFSEDNTWIEISPENGDIEIESMEITKGD